MARQGMNSAARAPATGGSEDCRSEAGHLIFVKARGRVWLHSFSHPLTGARVSPTGLGWASRALRSQPWPVSSCHRSTSAPVDPIRGRFFCKIPREIGRLGRPLVDERSNSLEIKPADRDQQDHRGRQQCKLCCRVVAEAMGTMIALHCHRASPSRQILKGPMAPLQAYQNLVVSDCRPH